MSRKSLLLILLFLALASTASAQVCGKYVVNGVTGYLDCITGVTGGTGTGSGATNGAIYWDGNQLSSTATGGAGTLCLISASGGAPVWGSCAGSASTVWSALSNPSGNLALAIGANLNSFTTSGNTGTNVIWSYLDTTGNTGTGYLFDIHSVGTSAINPLRVCAKGTTNCVSLSAAGLWAASGTAGISATHINGTALSGLATGILKNTTTTGIPSIAVAGDFPTLNQNTTGTAANVTGIVAEANGGTGANNTVGAAGHYLRSNATHYVDSAIQAGDVPTLNQNTTGTAATITGALALANTPLTTQGDLLFANASPALARLALGTNGQCVTSNGTTVVWGSCGLAVLSGLTGATGSNTIANGNNPQTWNWAQTSNTQYAMKFGETSAATGGTGTAQGEVDIATLAGSTAVPLTVINSLTGSQTLPALLIAPTWNTTGVVDAALLVNVTNTASGAGSLLADLQVGGTTQWNADKAGNTKQAGTASFNVGSSTGGAVELTQGTATTPDANSIILQAPTSVPTAYSLTYPSAVSAGFWRATSGGLLSLTELSGDCSTAGSGVLTCTKVNGVSYPATSASFDSIPILTASNTVNYEQINGGSSCGDSTHAISYNQTTHTFGCQSITGSATVTGTASGLVYNNAGAAVGINGFTSNGSSTITAAAAGVLNLGGATGTAAFTLPTNSSNTATSAGVCDYDSTSSNVHCNNGADSIVPVVTAASVPASGELAAFTVSSGKLTLTDGGATPATPVVCIGSATPDTSAVQTAAASGSWVFPKNGTCLLNNITFGSNVTWNLNGTTLKQNATSGPMLTPNGQTNILIFNGTIDQNQTAITVSGQKFSVYATNMSGFTMRDITFLNSGSATGMGDQGALKIDGCFACILDHLYPQSTILGSVGGGGQIAIANIAGSGGSIMLSNSFFSGGQANQLYITGGSAGSDVQVINNFFVGVGQQAGNTGQTGNAIDVFSQAGKVSIEGNQILNPAFTCVRINATAARVVVNGNVCEGANENSIYSELGTEGTVITNNIIANGFGTAINSANYGSRTNGAQDVISGNQIFNMAYQGIYAESDIITNNSISQVPVGITIQNGFGNQISGNNFTHTTLAINVDSGLSLTPNDQIGIEVFASAGMNSQSTTIAPNAMSLSTICQLTGISVANPAVLTYTAMSCPTPPTANQVYVFQGIYGMTQINGLLCTISSPSSTTATCTGLNSSTFSAFASNPNAGATPIIRLAYSSGTTPAISGLPSVVKWGSSLTGQSGNLVTDDITSLASLATVHGTTIPSSAVLATAASGGSLTTTGAFAANLTFTAGSTPTFPSGTTTLTQVVASGQTAMPTAVLLGNSCSPSATTATATGGATTDAVEVTYASDPTGVTGYGGGTSGGITIRPWVTANTINFKLCNETGSSITPGALNVNWRIVR